MEKTYPEELYRGVSASDQVTSQGYAMAGAFRFPNYDGKLRNGDGFCEVSVNWNDDDGSLVTLLNQHKPGKEDYQFKIGYFMMNRTVLHLTMKQYIDDGIFDYERRPVEATEDNDYQANPYHGNLLMKNTVDSNIRKNIQHTLATIAGRIVPR